MPAKLKFTLIAALALLAVPGMAFASVGEINSASPGAERILITSDGGLVVYSADGKLAAGFPVWPIGVFENEPLAGDFDAVLGNEIAVAERQAGDNYYLHLYNSSGIELSSVALTDYSAKINPTTLYNYVSKKHSVIYSAANGDVKELVLNGSTWSNNLIITGSGTEAFLSADSGKILIYYAPNGGSQIKVYKKTAGWNLLKTINVASAISHPIVDDGIGQLWFLSDNKLYSYSANGNLLAGFPITLSAKGMDLLVADIDKDNIGLEAGVQFNDGRLALYNYQGQLLKDKFIKEKFSVWQALAYEKEQGIFTYSSNNVLRIKSGSILDRTSVLNTGATPLFFKSINFTSSTNELDPKLIPPDPVTGLTATSSPQMITLTWDAYVDNYGDFNRFEIYRTNSTGTLLTELTPIAATTDMATTSYIDNVPAGTYYYIVATVDNDGNLTSSGSGQDGNWLGPVVVNAPKYPELALNYLNSNVGNNATINFGAIAVNTILDLEFIIANQGNANLLLIGNPLVGVTGTDYGEFNITALPAQILEPTVTSAFIIRFVPKTIGGKSATIEIANNDSDENPFTFNLVANVYDAAPLPVTGLTVSSTASAINLSWQPYADVDKDFDHFNIYRSSSTSSPFSSSTLLATISEQASTGYQDTTAKFGELYYYAMIVVDKAGNNSPSTGWVGPVVLSFPNILLSLSFNEPAQSTAFVDISGNVNNGVCAIASDCPQAGVAGKNDTAVSFNGTSSQITVPSSGTLIPKQTVSIEAWIKPEPDSEHKYQVVALKNLNYELSISNTGALHIGITNEANARVVFDTPPALKMNEWNYVVMTYDGSLVKGYVNGQLFGSMPQTGLIRVDSQPLTIGYWNNYFHFKGLIDDLNVYGYALTAEEIEKKSI